MEDMLRAILRQLLISNQIKLTEFSKNPLEAGIYSEEIKVWNDAIKLDINILKSKLNDIGGSDDV